MWELAVPFTMYEVSDSGEVRNIKTKRVLMFDSAHDAENRTGIPAKSIQKCCTGKLQTTHGASFAYLGAGVVSE